MIGRASCATTRRKLQRQHGSVAVALWLSTAFWCVFSPSFLDAQEDATGATTPQSTAVQTATVRGIVRNSQSGTGIPRVLVQVEGDARTGILTDGEGRFEIANVPVGPQSFTIGKPGFQDLPFGGAAVEHFSLLLGTSALLASGNHNVVVAGGLEDLVFNMAPLGELHGQVLYASGEAAPNVSVLMAVRTVVEGRAVWQINVTAKTRSNGRFLFGSLPQGEYALFTMPFLDSDLSAGNDDDEAPAEASEALGYASVYYPDARDPSGAGRIPLAAGQQQNLTLTLTAEPFHRVTVPVTGHASAYTGSLTNHIGQTLPYTAHYRAEQHALEALLPDGDYRMQVTSALPVNGISGPHVSFPIAQLGRVEFTVAGKPITTSPVAVGPQKPPAIEVSLLGSGWSIEESKARVVIVSHPASGWIDDGLIAAYAEGSIAGPLPTTPTAPGIHWLSPQIDQGSFCEASFTAASTSLAREPLQVAEGGATSLVTLTLRRDCAKLTLSLSDSVMAFGAGEEPYYTVYVVPDFDSARAVRERVLRPTSGQSATLRGLTPGNYHVYLFAGPRRLAYRDREALATLHGQAVTLAPGADVELVLETPAP